MNPTLPNGNISRKSPFEEHDDLEKSQNTQNDINESAHFM